MAAPSAKKRLVHHLDTPFSTSSWPEISIDDQDSILELLCQYVCSFRLLVNKHRDFCVAAKRDISSWLWRPPNTDKRHQSLLSPIGQHRRIHAKVSKGKRAAKREKRTKSKLDEVPNSVTMPAPPIPELSASVDIGFHSITRTLGLLTKPSDEASPSHKGYSMIFVARGSQSQTFNQHFPQMVAAASRNLPDKEKIRLVGFSKPCSERIGSVLGIPRVSSVAVSRHAPGADALFAVVQDIVAPVDSPWLNESPSTAYKTTRIGSVETTIGTKRVK